MTDKIPIIERAFQLARSGAFAVMKDIVQALDVEGYTNARGHLIGPTLRRQLSDACRTARGGNAVSEKAKNSNAMRRKQAAAEKGEPG